MERKYSLHEQFKEYHKTFQLFALFRHFAVLTVWTLDQYLEAHFLSDLPPPCFLQNRTWSLVLCPQEKVCLPFDEREITINHLVFSYWFWRPLGRIMSGLLYKSVSTDLSNVGRSKKKMGRRKKISSCQITHKLTF